VSVVEAQPWLRPEQIVTAVCEWTGIAKKDLISAQKISGRTMQARRLLWAAMRVEGMSYPEIGRYVGRHHTTIMAAMASSHPIGNEVHALLRKARAS